MQYTTNLPALDIFEERKKKKTKVKIKRKKN